jgi:tetratricopeptide (TPR) repeat protein
MIRVKAVSLTLALFCNFACSQKAARVKASPPVSGVRAAMNRQIRNAVEAGSGDYDLQRLRERMAVEPDNIELRLELAGRYEQAGIKELALEHYRLAAQRFPDHGGVHAKLVRSLRAHGLVEEAVGAADRFLKGHPEGKHWELASWLGILHDEAGRLREGEQYHRMAISQSESKGSLYNNLGQNQLLQGKRAEAIAAFRKAMEIDPKSEIARNNLGVALAADPKLALAQLESVSDPATAHNNLAAVLIEEGKYEDARKEIDIALGYKPDHAAALRNLGIVSERDGQPAVVKREPPKSFWGRLGVAMEKVFLTPEPSGKI